MNNNRAYGPRTLELVAVVAANPGCSKKFAATAVGPHGSNFFGCQTVDRAAARGLVHIGGDSRRCALTVTEAGLAAIGADVAVAR